MTPRTPTTAADELRDWLIWARERLAGVPHPRIIERIRGEAAEDAVESYKAEAAERAAAPGLPFAPDWLVLYDDYERGTAFITEDADQSGIIADDLPFTKAKNIADEHNATLLLAAPAPAPLAVEVLARALSNLHADIRYVGPGHAPDPTPSGRKRRPLWVCAVCGMEMAESRTERHRRYESKAPNREWHYAQPVAAILAEIERAQR